MESRIIQKVNQQLSDFKVTIANELRKDAPLEKWYLAGRFGALPIISNFKIN